ncbi:MAG: non-ribosomal peptide synthetase [Lachnospiraceae bacterium]|nr:non-ribosomal peptide synthetase [Lachnospiraceae bacterium]
MKHFKTFIADSICINALNDTVIPDEQSFTDTALLLVGLINRVYERDDSVPFCVDFPSGSNKKSADNHKKTDCNEVSDNREIPGAGTYSKTNEDTKNTNCSRIYAKLTADDNDTVQTAVKKLDKSREMPSDYGMGSEDGLFGLDFSATLQDNGSLKIDICFDDEKHTSVQVDTVINMLQVIAEQIAGDPKISLAQLDLVSPEESGRIIEASKGIDLPVDRSKTWLDLFKEKVSASPGALAVSAENGTYTYKELDTASDMLALSLLDRGAKPGDFIVLKLDRVKEFVTAVTGIHKAGCAYVPVDPSYPDERISFMTEDSGADIILTESDIRSAAESYAINGLCDRAKELPGADPEGCAYMIYTSGSTGKPKGVKIAHKSLMNFTVSISHLAGIRNTDRIIAHRSFSFDAHIEDYFPTLSSGASVFILGEDKRRDYDEIAAYIRENHLTGGGFTTSVARVLMTGYDLPLRYIIAGGEALYGITGKSSIQIINEYGPTECTDDSTWFPLETGVVYNNVPIGRAMPNTWCFVLDKHEKLLPLGVAGELCVAGIQVGIGYHNRNELTEKVFRDCPYITGERMYHTGDLVRYNEDGNIEFLGRIDNQVKLRGYRIELGEIEAVAGRHPGVRESVATVSELPGGRHLILYYTVRENAVVDESRMRNHMDSSDLPDYMKPEIYMKLDRMPLLPNAKIDRKNLPLPKYETDIIGEPPQTALETHLLNAARKCLPGIDFGVTDDMFSLGMTSLGAMRFASMINSLKLNLKCRVSDVIRYRTIKKLIEGNRRVFWNYDNYDSNKPMLVFIYGIAPVARTLHMLSLFNTEFNIFVIEATDSHYDLLFKEESFDEVQDMYMTVLENHLPQGCDTIDGFMGFSWGGFVSYVLAAQWAKRYGNKPFVMMGDSDFANKITDEPPTLLTLEAYPENLFDLTGGAITQIEVVNKNNMVARIDKTVKEIPKYDGRVIQLNAQKAENEEIRASKKKNLEIIKQYAENLEIVDFPNHDHNDLFYDENMFKRYLEIMLHHT